MLVRKEAGSGDARLALLSSWAIVAVVTFQVTASAASQVNDDFSTLERFVDVIGVVVAAALLVVVQLRTTRRQPVRAWWVWTLVAAASTSVVIGGWLAGALVIGALAVTMRGPWVLRTVGGYCAAYAIYVSLRDTHPLYGVWYLLTISAIGLLLYVLTRLAIVVSELAQARETVARLQVDEERHRISRDLHDILGRSLVAVSLRVQTAIRLLARDPASAGEQLDKVARMVADGQTRLRGLTLGATVLGVTQEIVTARDLFDRLGIQCDVEVTESSAQRPIVDELGGRVIRECVTNVLKHSRPTHVEITLREESATSVLAVINDGAAAISDSAGTGLTDLAHRITVLGGSLEAGRAPGGRFRVIARLSHGSLAVPDPQPSAIAPGVS